MVERVQLNDYQRNRQSYYDTADGLIMCSCQAEQIRLEQAFSLLMPLLLISVLDAQRQRCFPRSV